MKSTKIEEQVAISYSISILMFAYKTGDWSGNSISYMQTLSLTLITFKIDSDSDKDKTLISTDTYSLHLHLHGHLH